MKQELGISILALSLALSTANAAGFDNKAYVNLGYVHKNMNQTSSLHIVDQAYKPAVLDKVSSTGRSSISGKPKAILNWFKSLFK